MNNFGRNYCENMTENSQSNLQTFKLITASFFAMAITIVPITSTELWMIRNIAAHAFKRGIISRFPHLSLRSTNHTGQQLRLKIEPVSEPVRAVPTSARYSARRPFPMFPSGAAARRHPLSFRAAAVSRWSEGSKVKPSHTRHAQTDRHTREISRTTLVTRCRR